jgi:hypothetical protein
MGRKLLSLLVQVHGAAAASAAGPLFSELGVVRILVGPDQGFDLQVEQGVECRATKPKNEKKYSFHLSLL